MNALDEFGNTALIHAFDMEATHHAPTEPHGIRSNSPGFWMPRVINPMARPSRGFWAGEDYVVSFTVFPRDKLYAGKIKTAKLLIKKGASIDKAGKGGNTALTMAAGWGAVEGVALLIKNGADVNRATNLDMTALMLSVEAPPRFAIPICRMLLRKGVDINAVDVSGNTVLMRAVPLSDAVFRFLLKNGADVHARNNSGETALIKARKMPGCCWSAKIRMLLRYGSPEDEEVRVPRLTSMSGR